MLTLLKILRYFLPAALIAAAGPTLAQGRLEAQYTVTLAGIPIGKGSWVIDITDTRYSAAATGVTTGMIWAFTGGQGTSAASGTWQAGKPVSSSYAASITTRKKTDMTQLLVSNGTVKDSKLDPPLDRDKSRIAITEANQRGVQDPMTASLLRVPGTGDHLAPEACQRTLAIFDGRLRYDLQLAFKRMDRVKASKGYAGPVLVCAVYFSPVAGFIPSRASIKYLSKMRDMEVWLAPIAGTRVLVPFRAQGPTPIGTAVLEADQFVSLAMPASQTVQGPVKASIKEPTKIPTVSITSPSMHESKAQ